MDPVYTSEHLYLALIGGFLFVSLYLLIQWLVRSHEISLDDGNKPGFYSAEIAQRSVSIVVGVIFTVSGVYVVFEVDDIIYGRSKVLLKSACFISLYFIQDLVTMFISYRYSRECVTSSNSLITTIANFIISKPLMTVHHIMFIILTVPFSEGALRSHFGDWYVGCLFIMESSTPLLSLHFIFGYIGMKDSFIQQCNGVLFLVTFFIVRILVFPFMYGMYIYRYHNGDILAGLNNMYWFCHTTVFVFFLMQFFWFIAALRKVLRGISRIYRKEHEQ